MQTERNPHDGAALQYAFRRCLEVYRSQSHSRDTHTPNGLLWDDSRIRVRIRQRF
jgi:hypothetical protein